MAQYTFEEIKSVLERAIKEYGCEAELRLFINDNEYMIIIYEDFCDFIKCGDNPMCRSFKSLYELYRTEQVDNIILARDWNKITKFESCDLEIFGLW